MKAKTEISARAKREAAATKRRPLRTLPDAWYEQGVAENMSEWIKKQKELRERASH